MAVMDNSDITETRFRSKLGPFEDEIRNLKESGGSTRSIAHEMKIRHGLEVSHNAVASFLRTHGENRRSVLARVPIGRREELKRALKALWTHDSTGIEGNTLTLGDTLFVLQYGLTVKGKPLKDHDDVIAHGKGIDLIQSMIAKTSISTADIFDLHRTVVVHDVMDIYKPVGAWKREENGTYNAVDGKPVYMPYAPVDDTPELMSRWIKAFNRSLKRPTSAEAALNAYLLAHVSFVRIHPFFDGNGRLARLLANLPVLISGFPPIVIPMEARADYISALGSYQRAVGTITRAQPDLLPRPELLAELRTLVQTWWRSTLDLVAAAQT